MADDVSISQGHLRVPRIGGLRLKSRTVCRPRRLPVAYARASACQATTWRRWASISTPSPTTALPRPAKRCP